VAGALIDHFTDLMRAVWHGQAERPEVIKLTAEQREELRAAGPPPAPEPYGQPGGSGWAALTGVPVVLVDTVEESTPYERGWLTAHREEQEIAQ
jgi:hypothetical protein